MWASRHGQAASSISWCSLVQLESWAQVWYATFSALSMPQPQLCSRSMWESVRIGNPTACLAVRTLILVLHAAGGSASHAALIRRLTSVLTNARSTLQRD